MSICLVRFCAVGVKFVLLRVPQFSEHFNNIDTLVVIYSIPKIYRFEWQYSVTEQGTLSFLPGNKEM